MIDAPLQRVWDLHTDVASWNQWQDAVLTVERLDSGAFSSSSRFRWTTPVHTEESWDAPLLDSLRGPDRDAVAAMLGGGLDVWLQALKTTAETPAG